MVAREFRRQGHGRYLLQYVINAIKQLYPNLTRVVLEVFAHNPARTLYEKENFRLSVIQPRHLVTSNSVQYERNLVE